MDGAKAESDRYTFRAPGTPGCHFVVASGQHLEHKALVVVENCGGAVLL